MRLINIETLKLEQFQQKFPPYTILSHTWGADEVTFQDFANTNLRRKKAGFRKIELTCAQAQKDGLRYAWVDTCCIDKTKSAELEEAIKSMFKWYQQSVVCYVYLIDVPESDNIRVKGSKFSQSRWFTRGWTLQELIAPGKVVFYGANWGRLGDKISLGAQLFDITNIRPGILKGGKLSEISLAERMSWASGRQTTRLEDTAYCLMGIFDANMPMLYGEGAKAFLRLQEHILKDSDDHSLFAWRASTKSATEAPYRGLLADSPAEFVGCAGIVAFRSVTANKLHQSITNRGVPLTSNQHAIPGSPNKILASLNCRWGDDFTSVVSIELIGQGGDQFMRASPDRLFKAPSYGDEGTAFVVKSANKSSISSPPLLERQFGFYFGSLPDGMRIGSVWGQDINFSSDLRLLHIGPWISDKATVQLVWDGPSGKPADSCLLLFLWAEPVRTGQRTTYKQCFDLAVCPNAKIRETIARARKPSQQIEDQMASLGSLAPRRPSVVVSIKLRKVQGFDMFVVEARNGPGNTVVSPGPQNSASAGGNRQDKRVAGKGTMQGMLGRMGRAMFWNRVKC